MFLVAWVIGEGKGKLKEEMRQIGKIVLMEIVRGEK